MVALVCSLAVAACAAAVAVLVGVRGGLLLKPAHPSDCTCPPGYPHVVVVNQKCFAHAGPDARCESKQNGFKLGDDLACWDGVIVTRQCQIRVAHGLAKLLPDLQIRVSALFMAYNLEDAEASAKACEKQAALAGSATASEKPVAERQRQLVAAGFHELAVRAMRRHPAELPVQAACAELLVKTAAWNPDVAEAVGEAGAQEVVLGYCDRFIHLESVRSYTGTLGLFMDPSVANRHRFRRLGGFHKFFEWKEKHYTEELMCTLQCIVSTQSVPENQELLVELGYLPLTVQAMKDFRRHCNRGEAVFNVANIFLSRPAWADELYRLGMAQEALGVMRDEPDEYDAGRSLDPLGTEGKAGMARAVHSSMRVLRGLADGNSTRRDALFGAGVFGEIATMLRRVGALQYRAVWGADFDVLEAACSTLHAFLDAESGAGRAAFRESGAFGEVSTQLSGRSDSDIPQACNSLRLAAG